MATLDIQVDAGEAAELITKLKRVASPEQFNTVLRRTISDAGHKVKTIVRQEVPKEYGVPGSWAAAAVRSPKMQSGDQIGAIIPIVGTRGGIGPRFKLKGRAWKKGKPIHTLIYKKDISTLPGHMANQGGQPPFVAGGVVYTRKVAHQARPIARVVGLAAPEMPTNRARARFESELGTFIDKRLEHHIQFVLGLG